MIKLAVMRKRNSRKFRNPPERERPRTKTTSPSRLEILFEDAAIVVVNKPAGLPSVPVDGARGPSALSLLTGKLRSRRERAFVVHRIDRFTSGIILFAKTAGDQQNLVDQFLKHTPVRGYHAVVRGLLKRNEGELVHYLRRQGVVQTVTSKADPGAARARLSYVVERELRNATLVRVTLDTGLQNQIRVQFARIGHPVIGDRKYSPAEKFSKDQLRLALHASHLSFRHPRTGQVQSINCRIPPEFQALIRSVAEGT